MPGHDKRRDALADSVDPRSRVRVRGQPSLVQWQDSAVACVRSPSTARMPPTESANREHTYDASFWRQWQSKQQAPAPAKQQEEPKGAPRRRRRQRRPTLPEPLPAAAIARGGAPVVLAARFGSSARFGETEPVDEPVFPAADCPHFVLPARFPRGNGSGGVSLTPLLLRKKVPRRRAR